MSLHLPPDLRPAPQQATSNVDSIPPVLEESGRSAPSLDRKSWRDIARAGITNVFAAGASLLILVMTSHTLGPSGRGVYAAVTAWVGFFATLGSLSLGQALLHHLTQNRGQSISPDVAGTLRGLVIRISLGAWTLAGVCYLFTDGRFFQNLSPRLLAVAFISLPFTLWFDNGRYLLFALDRVKEFNYSQVIGYTVSVAVLAAALFVMHLGLTTAITAWVLLYVVMALMGYRSVTSGTAVRYSAPLARRLIRSGAKLHLNTISTFIHIQSSVLILNYFRPPAEVGYYQLATQVVALGTLVPLGISSVAYSQVVNDGPDRAWAKQRQLIKVSLATAVVSIVLGYFLSPVAVRLLAGEAFLPAVPLIRILLLSLLGMSISMSMASQWIGRGLFWQTAVLSSAMAAVSFALDVALIPRYGMYGALYSTLAIYGVALLVNGTFAIRIERRLRLVHL